MATILASLKEKQKTIHQLHLKITFAETWLEENLHALSDSRKLDALNRLEFLYNSFLNLTGYYHHSFTTVGNPTKPLPPADPLLATSGTYIDQYGQKTTTLHEALTLFD